MADATASQARSHLSVTNLYTAALWTPSTTGGAAHRRRGCIPALSSPTRDAHNGTKRSQR
ncbi:hypothetical protein XCR_0579 [Xanthomonas campestris pv. raphani 756C]|nr:hypothetical protein XCR_0579 [Xanthomonas campestris pv. raphani 756C]